MEARLRAAALRIATSTRCPTPSDAEVNAALSVLHDVREETRLRALEE